MRRAGQLRHPGQPAGESWPEKVVSSGGAGEVIQSATSFLTLVIVQSQIAEVTSVQTPPSIVLNSSSQFENWPRLGGDFLLWVQMRGFCMFCSCHRSTMINFLYEILFLCKMFCVKSLYKNKKI
jgi:hypothetical protein